MSGLFAYGGKGLIIPTIVVIATTHHHNWKLQYNASGYNMLIAVRDGEKFREIAIVSFTIWDQRNTVRNERLYTQSTNYLFSTYILYRQPLQP